MQEEDKDEQGVGGQSGKWGTRRTSRMSRQ